MKIHKIFINEMSITTEIKNLKQKLSLLKELKLNETFNKEKMRSSLELIKKLKSTDFKIEQLDKAKNIALKEVNESLLGANDKNIFQKFLGIFKKDKPQENPIHKSLSFISALNNFFDSFIPYIEEMSNIKDDFKVIDQKTTLIELITGMQGADQNTLAASSKEVKKNYNNYVRLIKNGLKPQQIFGTNNTWYTDYIGGDNGVKILAQQLLQLTINDIKNIANSVNSNFSTVDEVGKELISQEQTITQIDTSEKDDVYVKELANDVSKIANVDKETTMTILNLLKQNNKLK